MNSPINTTRSIRVRTENVYGIIAALIVAGFTARLEEGRPSACYCGGCPDPECCHPHPEAEILDGWAYMPDTWSSIETSASGHKAHQVIEAWKADKDNLNLTRSAMTRVKIMTHNGCSACSHLYRGEHTGELLCDLEDSPLRHVPRPWGDGRLTGMDCSVSYPKG